MLFDIEVRPGRDTGFFQPYTETVEAATSHDAVARVQRANPGCQVWCSRSYNKPRENHSSGSDTDAGGLLTLAAVVFVIWLLAEYWWIVLPIGGIILLIMLIDAIAD